MSRIRGEDYFPPHGARHDGDDARVRAYAVGRSIAAAELAEMRERAERAEAERDRLDIGVNTLEYRVNKIREYANGCLDTPGDNPAREWLVAVGSDLLGIVDGEVSDDDES